MINSAPTTDHPHFRTATLERVGSAHSSQTAASTDATGSNNTYSTSTSAMSGLATPTYHADVDDHGPEEELTDGEKEDMYAEADSARRRLGAGGTRSMQDLKRERGRQRSLTDSRPADRSLVLAPPVPSHPPVGIRQHPQPAPVSKPPKTPGSFSSFLRRLTGKGPKNKDKNIPSNPPPRMAAAFQNASPPKAKALATPWPQVTRQDSAPSIPSSAPIPRRTTVRQHSMPTRPLLNQIETRETLRGPQPLSAPVRSAPRLPQAAQETDPVKVPLPPSPTLSPVANPFESNLGDFAPPASSSAHHSQRGKQSPMLSFEGFEIEEESEEEVDEVRPLRPLRITVDSSHRSLSPDSAPLKSSSSAETTIRTPSSAIAPNYFQPMASGSGSESSPERRMATLSGNSPSKDGASTLDRKGSKWRKSVMGIDTVSRKQTTRLPPPSSSYEAQRRHMADKRMSCQPTLHSNASITANLTAIKSKEEQDIAETFFLA